MSTDNSQSIKTVEVLIKTHQLDPEVIRQLNPEVLKHLDLEAINKKLQKRLKIWAEGLRERVPEISKAIKQIDDELESMGFDPPGLDIEKWVHLSRIVEREPNQKNLQEIVDWARAWVDRKKIESQLQAQQSLSVGAKPGAEQLTPETRAILFIQERIKTTGKLPPKKDIAKALHVNRRTLNNWTAFKVAYKQFKQINHTSLPKGSKDKEGMLEAWEENGKKST